MVRENQSINQINGKRWQISGLTLDFWLRKSEQERRLVLSFLTSWPQRCHINHIFDSFLLYFMNLKFEYNQDVKTAQEVAVSNKIIGFLQTLGSSSMREEPRATKGWGKLLYRSLAQTRLNGASAAPLRCSQDYAVASTEYAEEQRKFESTKLV